MADSVNMSLDEIIKKNKQFRASRSRGRGGGSGIARGRGETTRGRGGGRGGGRGRGRGRVPSRSGTPVQTSSQYQGRGRGRRSQSRSRSQSRTRSQSRARSRSRQRRSNSRGRSASRSRSQLRRLTPKGRAGLEDHHSEMPPLMRGKPRGGGLQYKLRRGNSKVNGGWQQQSQGIHSRLGVVTRRGGAYPNQPLAVPKRGISKRGRGLTTGNRYSAVGLRSDQILKQQRQHLIHQSNIIRSQTFRRSRNNSFNDISQLTVSVRNDLVKRRRNSMGSNNYLNKKSLNQLTSQYGGYTKKRGTGSVRSNGSYRSNNSNRSNSSARSGRSGRSRGRGRGGRGGVGRNFVSKRYLNPKLQKEIADMQQNANREPQVHELSVDSEFRPTPASTGQTLHQRFGL